MITRCQTIDDWTLILECLGHTITLKKKKREKKWLTYMSFKSDLLIKQ